MTSWSWTLYIAFKQVPASHLKVPVLWCIPARRMQDLVEGALSSTKKPLCHINQVRFVAMNGTRRKNIKNRFVSAFICCSRLSLKGEKMEKEEQKGNFCRKNAKKLLFLPLFFLEKSPCANFLQLLFAHVKTGCQPCHFNLSSTVHCTAPAG